MFSLAGVVFFILSFTVFCPLGYFVRSWLSVNYIIPLFSSSFQPFHHLFTLIKFTRVDPHVDFLVAFLPGVCWPSWVTGLIFFIRTFFRHFFLESGCCLILPIISVLLTSSVCCQACYGHIGIRLAFLSTLVPATQISLT